MRRTYRSKKETGGALDHRDVILSTDVKSSVFDAFYIQNLKQTKRELAYGIASNKVRKRKLVKRIVKDVENIQPRESLSASTYLTPEKSIRVNKIQDPFDMLLNSSPKNLHVSQDNINYVKKKSKPYIKKDIRAKAKKINYSSDYSSDPDKENTTDKNFNVNMTDIRTHELIVESKQCKSPKYCDESISKIVNNLSLINKYKTGNSSYNTSYKYRNKLIKKNQSPTLQKSPLCSTPFKDKYRGKSIFNFSPITTIERDNSIYMAISEEKNDSNANIVVKCKNTFSMSPNQSSLLASVLMNETAENLHTESEKHNLNETNKKNESALNEESLIKITEPFLGFSNEVNDSVVKNSSYLMKNIDRVLPKTLESKNKKYTDYSAVTYESNETSDSDSNNSSLMFQDSVYDTCHSEQSISEKVIGERREPRVAIERLNDSVFIKYYEKMLINKKNTSYTDNIFDSISEDEHVSTLLDKRQNNDDKKFTNPTDYKNESTGSENELNYEHLGDLDAIQNNIDKTNHDETKPIHDANKSLDDEVCELLNEHRSELQGKPNNDNKSHCHGRKPIEFNKSYGVKEDNLSDENQIEQSDLQIYFDDSQSYESNSIGNGQDKSKSDTQDNISSTSKSTESDSVEIQPNVIVLSDYSTTEDLESNDEEITIDDKFVSFVTTRRKHEIANDSLFMFNNSYGSSSTDCDQTILSNRARLSCFGKSVTGLDISVDEGNVHNTNVNVLTESNDDTLSSIATRRSARLNGLSDFNADFDYTINNINVLVSEEFKDTKSEEPSQNQDAPFPKQNIFSPCTRKSTRVTAPEHKLSSVSSRKSSGTFRDSVSNRSTADTEIKPSIVLQPGKKWERSLSIYRRLTTMTDHFDQSIMEDDGPQKGRKYRQSVLSTMELQDSLHNESINSRRSTFISKPNRSTIRFVKDSNNSRISLSTTEVFDELKGFLNEECDDTVIELSKLSLADSELDVTVLENFHETSGRIATARDYVLRRCNQTEPIQFDECYPKTVLKNCHKIGEGVYGEVFLWRANDGRARVMKIVPIAGTVKVNGEEQKDYHEVISEIVIAMELSALRAPIADIDRYFDEGKDVDALDLHSVENGTDVFNEVVAVRCVQGPYPSRLLDLWELYDECRGSENDNPASLPDDQHYIVLELANAGQDLESYQFTGAQQAHALFQQIAFGLAVGEESFQFEHRDLHWGNVLIAPTEQKFATFVVRGRTHRVARGGVAATIIDYSLSRISLPLGAEQAALYNDLAQDEQLFEAVGDYQFQVYRLMRDKLRNDWKNFEPYTNILWLHYTIDKMITALRYKRTTTKIHKHYIEKLKGIKERILDYKSATDYVLTDIEI